jgi:hypothetical protein
MAIDGHFLFEGQVLSGQCGIYVSNGLPRAFGTELLGFANKAVNKKNITRFGYGIIICIAGKQHKQRDGGCKKMRKYFWHQEKCYPSLIVENANLLKYIVLKYRQDALRIQAGKPFFSNFSD